MAMGDRIYVTKLKKKKRPSVFKSWLIHYIDRISPVVMKRENSFLYRFTTINLGYANEHTKNAPLLYLCLKPVLHTFKVPRSYI